MGSGQSGTATLTNMFARIDGAEYVNVHIDTHGGTDTPSQDAHIHSGTCANNNGPIFATLGIVEGGVKDYAIGHTFPSLTGGHRYIDIHNSADSSRLQSCGDIP